jgi:hypothetical protein
LLFFCQFCEVTKVAMIYKKFSQIWWQAKYGSKIC